MGIFAKEKIFFQQTKNALLQKIQFAVLCVIYYIYKNKNFRRNLWKIKWHFMLQQKLKGNFS